MATQPSPPTSATPGGDAATRYRVAVEFAIVGDLRFLSHHDELRLIARALTRARWPLAYTQGFNPRPRMTIPLPRNVGVAAECQLALVELREPRSSTELSESLAGQLPAGCHLRRVVAWTSGGKPHPLRVTYELDLSAGDAQRVRPRLAQLTARPVVTIRRDYGPRKPARPVDLRPYIEQLEMAGDCLRLRLRFVEQRTARPSEVITELGLAPAAHHHRLRRADVQWDTELAAAADGGPAAQERNHFGQEENDDPRGNQQDRA